MFQTQLSAVWDRTVSNSTFQYKLKPDNRLHIQHLKALFAWSVLVVFLLHAGIPGARAAGPRSSYPSSAYVLPASGNIPSALTTYGTVVLSKADYSAQGAFTLKSGQKLYGHQAGSTIPPVTVEAGAKGCILSNVAVTGTGITFPPSSSAVTSGCVFDRLSTRIVINGAILTDNLFLHVDGPMNINTSTSGYLRNNRFIRTKAHGHSDQLVMLGDPSWRTSNRKSYGNVFLWKNFLTPAGDSTNINNQADLTVVGVDAESWNFNGTGTGAALWKVGSMGVFRAFAMNGGNHGAYKTGDFDVNADEFQLYNDNMEKIASPLIDYKLGANNVRSLLISSSSASKVWSTDPVSNPFHLKAFDAGSTTVATSVSSGTTPVWTNYSGALPAGQDAILRSMVVNPTRISGEVPWERPTADAIPDPGGSGWATNRASEANDSVQLQAWIDSGAKIPAGTYYIDQPLKIRMNQAIIGSGADSTLVIAKNSSVNMVIADDTVNPTTQPTGRRITIADITFQGGNNGLYLDPVGTGTTTAGGAAIIKTDGSAARAQYTACYINHVTFRNMTTAGIFMDRIYALDNIFFGYVHFVSCASGLKQQCDPGYTGGDAPADPYAARMMYMDKCVFYKCQFNGNTLALDLTGKRACNLNAWINCRFDSNSGGAANLVSYLTPVFANCYFYNNGGTAAVNSNALVLHVSNYLQSGPNGQSMFGGPVSAEGCVFDRWQSTTCKILRGNNTRVYLNNCSTGGGGNAFPTGLTSSVSGMILNSSLAAAADAALNQQVVSIVNGVPTTVVSGAPVTPKAQMLVGSSWSGSTYPIKDY